MYIEKAAEEMDDGRVDDSDMWCRMAVGGGKVHRFFYRDNVKTEDTKFMD